VARSCRIHWFTGEEAAVQEMGKIAPIILGTILMAIAAVQTPQAFGQPSAPASGAVTPPTSGFLGDYSQLKPGGAGQAQLVYINPDAKWPDYSKVILEPVELWGDGKGKPSEKARGEIRAFVFNVFKEELAKKFELTDQPGPGVMKISIAITSVKPAEPMIAAYDQHLTKPAEPGATLKFLGPGIAVWVGSASGEAQVADSVSGQRLGAWVDKRFGSEKVPPKKWKWGDAEAIVRKWADLLAERLAQLHAGKPG
jgi:hypothetical protein